MPTERQIAAARANGAQSRGPVTPEGKAVSSQNALKSGLHAKANVIRGEDPAEFEALVDRYYRTCQPVGADQEALVKTLIRTEWLLDRLHRLETRLWDHKMAEADRYPENDPFALAAIRGDDAFKLLQRRLDSANRTLLRTRELLIKLQKQKPAPQLADPEPDPPSVGSFSQPAPEPPLTPGPQPLTPAAEPPQPPSTPLQASQT